MLARPIGQRGCATHPASARVGIFYTGRPQHAEFELSSGSSQQQLSEAETRDHGAPAIGEVGVVALVPDRHDGLTDLERWLDAAALRQALGAMKPKETGVLVPKMRLSPHMDLIDPLSKMGMRDVFEGGTADLSGFSASGNKNLVVTDVAHAAFLEVDEEGTEAAAATGIAVGRAMAPAVVALDRPFLFLIRERTSGAILFMGRMVDPSA